MCMLVVCTGVAIQVAGMTVSTANPQCREHRRRWFDREQTGNYRHVHKQHNPFEGTWCPQVAPFLGEKRAKLGIIRFNM